MNDRQPRSERFRLARRDPTRCVLEGFHAIKHALRFGAEIEEVVTRDPGELARLAHELAPDVAAPITGQASPCSDDEYDALAPLAHPTGVMAIARRAGSDASQILAAAAGTVIALDNPVHLGNIGAVVRVAAAAGASGVISLGRHDPWSPEAVRAAAGLQFAVPAARADELEVDDTRLVIFDADAPLLYGAELPLAPVFVFGSERHGVDPAIQSRASHRASLPMQPGVSSLNLATAVAAAMYAIHAIQPR